MVEIFDKMMSKEFEETLLLSEAYAKIKGVNPQWVHVDGDCSIKEQCHRICDKLEAEGKDLDNLEVSVIRDEFLTLQFTIEYPLEYTALLKTLKKAEKARETLLSYDHTTEETIEGINDAVDWINKKIKEFER
tara:strand:- start:995 stop:1393 length:399 start_codon:yes stop_codon:yes gene_type:complete